MLPNAVGCAASCYGPVLHPVLRMSNSCGVAGVAATTAIFEARSMKTNKGSNHQNGNSNTLRTKSDSMKLQFLKKNFLLIIDLNQAFLNS